MVAEDAWSVGPETVDISVARGRPTGEEYFAIGVKVGVSLCGCNTVYLSIGSVYGPPGQPDPRASQREEDRQRNETMRYLMERRSPSPEYVVTGSRGAKGAIQLPNRTQRLAAYQACWDKICGDQPVGTATWPDTGSPGPKSQLYEFAQDAFQRGWNELDRDVQEDLSRKRLTGTTETSPLDKLSERIEEALRESIESEIVNSFAWSRLLAPSVFDKELHFFRYASREDLLRPATVTFQYKKAGEFIPQQGLHDQILFSESDASSLEHSSANDSEENSIGDIEARKPRPTRDSGHYSL